MPRLGTVLALLFALPPLHAETLIEWQRETTRLIEPGSTYGRMIRLRDGRFLVCYEKGHKAWTKTSADAVTWDAPVLAAEGEGSNAANPELLQLASGLILLPFNERPNPEDGRHRYSIRLAASRDGGKTWKERAEPVYQGGFKGSDGVWEPAAIQLPDNEIQLFFANEAVTRENREQAISMTRSRDDGKTWSPPQSVSLRPGFRDGMPVPLVLLGGRGIVFSVEDNGLAPESRFRPSIITSPLAGSWPSKPVSPPSPRRWPALKEGVPETCNIAAPYLRQLPTCETLLSAQSNQITGTSHVMVVYVGDDRAKNFASRTQPFSPADGVDCLWNSLCVKDSDTVYALTNTRIGETRGVWCVTGKVLRQPGK